MLGCSHRGHRRGLPPGRTQGLPFPKKGFRIVNIAVVGAVLLLPAVVPADRDVDVSWSEVRVGVILDAKPHPESDKLYVETIDLGEGTPRTVLSGLAQHMTLDQVKGARVVCICNLKPRKMAGIESQAMVLCASDADKSKLAFVEPPAGAAPGDLVTWDGFPGAPETAKKMDKKKAWESIQPCFATDGKGVATYKGAPFAVAASAAARIMSRPPEACTFRIDAPVAVAERTAPATVLGMS